MDNMPIVYGFASATILSFVLIIVALFMTKGIPAYIAALLSLPCSLYLALGLYVVPVLFPLLIVLGGYLLNQRKTVKAALCFAPYLLASGTIIIFGYILDAW